ncbi:MAG: bifunctional glutamate N-acetyltransferase/amino-acid acetyltransferase ArgJ [Actinomycetota bacterium]
MSVTAPAGWLASGVRAGTKPSGDLDLALVWSEHPATVAGAFTTSRVPSAHVILCRPRVSTGAARGVLVSAGIANAFTGPAGLEDAVRLAEAAADATGTAPEEMLVCATGTIGPRIPVDDVLPAIERASKELSTSGGADAARAILTTDKQPKTASRTVEVDGKAVTVGGMAKGAGMIAPNMEPQATLLVFVTTDAAADAATLRGVVASVVPYTFNAISVDRCMSTSDTVLLFANGASGADVSGSRSFSAAVREVMSELAYACVADGEGATRVIRVRVTGAVTEDEAREAAREIASSDLLRSAVWGNDPNLGRIVQALGQAPVTVEPDRLLVSMAGVPLSDGGRETGRRPEAAKALARGGDALIEADLGLGHASFEFLSCDLTPEYVTFNAEYTT